MKAMQTAAIIAMITLTLGCRSNTPDPEPMHWIEFSIDGGPMHTFTNGPTNLLMDVSGEPFMAIRDYGGGDTLFIYALAEDGPFVEETETSDRVILRINTDQASYAGTFTANLLFAGALDGVLYYQLGPNTLTLDSEVTKTPSGNTVSGTFSGVVNSVAMPEGLSIEGTFSVVDIAVTFPASGG